MNINLDMDFREHKGDNGLIGYASLVMESSFGKYYITGYRVYNRDGRVFVMAPSRKLKEAKYVKGTRTEYQENNFGSIHVKEWIQDKVRDLVKDKLEKV